MKHFIVEIKYKNPAEKIEKLRPLHREHLQRGYGSGILLVSGPKASGSGGIIVARANSMEELTGFFANDPYILENAADYFYIEFNPVSRQKILDNWIAGE